MLYTRTGQDFLLVLRLLNVKTPLKKKIILIWSFASLELCFAVLKYSS